MENTPRANVFRLLATDLAESVRLAYDTVPDAPDPPPPVRIAHGITVTQDVPYGVAISYELVQRASVGNDSFGILPSARMRVEVVTPYPMDVPVDLDEITEASLVLNDHATVLFYGLGQRWRDRTLFPHFSEMTHLGTRFEDMRPREPGGGRAGWWWRITVDMEGRPLA